MGILLVRAQQSGLSIGRTLEGVWEINSLEIDGPGDEIARRKGNVTE